MRRPRLLTRPALVLLAAGALTLSACGSGVSEGGDEGAADVEVTLADPTVPEATTSTTSAGAEPTTTTEGGATATTAGGEDGEDGEVPEPTSPDGLGDDPELDALAQDCFDGDFSACDQLFFESPVESDYEAYGDSCGGRNEPGGLCVNIYGEG